MPGLNLDVLCSVCNFITDVPDVLAFSLTCSTLRPPAIYRRLSMRPVTITDGTSINTLHDFIFVDKAARGPHIHAITIPQEATRLLQGSPEELLRRLLAILSASTRVHTLSLCLPAGISSSLLASPLIVPAIARLTGIQDLTLVSSLERANALLKCIRSPTETFRYQCLYKDLHTHRNANLNFIRSSTALSAIQRRMETRLEMYEKELTLEDLASHLCRTLRHLELPHLCLPRRAFQQVQPGPFLAVRSLVLRDITEIVRLDVLLHMLPNLGDMLVSEALPLFYKCMRDREHVEVVREANQLAQERHAWKKLDRVVATPLMLYTLGLTCPINHLILDLSPGSGFLCERLDALAQHARCAVLRDHTPTHLTVRGLRLPASLVHLDDLFSGDWALARTTHVVIDAEYHNVDADGKLLWPDDVLETLLSRIERPGLTHVRIVTSGLIHNADAFSASVHHGIRYLSLERLAIATQFQYAVPSLTHIFLTSRGVVLQSDNKLQEVWNVSKAWRVPSEESFGRHIEEMSFNDAEAVLNMEDMQTAGDWKNETY